MKKLLMMLTLALAALFAMPAMADDDDAAKSETSKVSREDKKAAADWMKRELTTIKKTTALLKKIKNEKTAKKVVKEVRSVNGLSTGSTAMGDAKPPTKPTGDAYTEQEEKNKAQLEKLRTDLQNEIERVRGLELNNSELNEALDWLFTNRA